MQADDEVGRGAGGAGAAIELGEALLGEGHDGVDHVGEAVVLLVLHADDVRCGGEDGEGAGWQEAYGLEFFAAEADDHGRAAEVGVEAEVAEGADGNLGAGCVDGDAAAVGVGEGDDVVDVGVAGEELGLDALDGEVDGGGDALDGGGDAEDVLRADGAVVVEEALEGVALEGRHRRRDGGREREGVERGGDWGGACALRAPNCLSGWRVRRTR